MNKMWWVCLVISFRLWAQNPTNDSLPHAPIVESIEQQNNQWEHYKKAVPVHELPVDQTQISPKKFKKNYKEQYTGADFIYSYEKKKELSVWERLKQWLSEFFSSRPTSPVPFQYMQLVLRILGYVIIIGIIGVVIRWLLTNDVSSVFRKKPKESGVDFLDVEKNIHQIHFQSLIDATLEQKKYRLATRYYYLWLLKRLSNAKLIVWDIEKTNTDYLAEIKEESLKSDFQYLSYLYNNIWYGEFEISENEFFKVQHAFTDVLQTYADYE